MAKPEHKSGASGLSNPVVRTAVKLASRKGVVEELSKGTTDDQVGRLGELVNTGTLSRHTLRDTIVRKAPREMDKAIRKYRKRSREITVDSLLAAVRGNTQFLTMCAGVGIGLDWFEQLARERMAKHGIPVEER